MTIATSEFTGRWASGKHFGAWKPQIQVFIREGSFEHNFYPWPGDDIDALFPNSSPSRPWYAKWVPATAWEQVPNILECGLEQDLDSNGVQHATIVIENRVPIEVPASSSFGGIYHAIERGYLSPYRGYDPESSIPGGATGLTPWYKRLVENAQIFVKQGYGEDGLVPTFTGIIEDIDLEAAPDRITLTLRDFSQTLTDQRCFGYVKDKNSKEPLVFMDRVKAQTDAKAKEEYTGIVSDKTQHVILVDDLSDIVKVVLRWAGFTEWEVESTGTQLQEKLVFNRATFLIDIIQKITTMTNYVFFIDTPSDEESIGVPVFRYNRAIQDRDDIPLVHDEQVLTGIKCRFSTEPLGTFIRVFGKVPKNPDVQETGARTVGADKTRRVYGSYSPPWRHTRLAGLIKHVIHYDNAIYSSAAAKMGCYFIALAEALKSATAVVEIPANPLIGLDSQVGVHDRGTGMATRLWVASRTSTYRNGERATWTMSLSGALVDTPDIKAIKRDINALASSGGGGVAAPLTGGLRAP